QVVVHAAQNQGAAQPRLALLEVELRQPVRGHNAAIESLSGVVVRDCSGEGKAQGTAPVGRVTPQVHAQQRARFKAPRGLFAHLAYHGRKQGLTALDVSGRLIENQPVVDALFHDQDAAGRFRDGRDGYVRRWGHAGDYSRRRRDSAGTEGSAAACGAQTVLDRARVPHLIEFLHVQARGHRVVDVGDTVPAVGAHTVDDRTVVGDEIPGGALWRLCGYVADVD